MSRGLVKDHQSRGACRETRGHHQLHGLVPRRRCHLRARLRIHRCNAGERIHRNRAIAVCPRGQPRPAYRCNALKIRGTCHRRKHLRARVELRAISADDSQIARHVVVAIVHRANISAAGILAVPDRYSRISAGACAGLQKRLNAVCAQHIVDFHSARARIRQVEVWRGESAREIRVGSLVERDPRRPVRKHIELERRAWGVFGQHLVKRHVQAKDAARDSAIVHLECPEGVRLIGCENVRHGPWRRQVRRHAAILRDDVIESL